MPPWIILLERWRFIAVSTLCVTILAVAAALVWPKTFRAVCLVMVNPPSYSESLVVPPKPLDMKTVSSIAGSYPVLQDVLNKVQAQRNYILHIRNQLEEKRRSGNLWDEIKRMPVRSAAAWIGAETDEDFRRNWEDLPSSDLLPGYLEFKDDDFEDVDPLVLSQYLKTKIQTKLENRLRVEYQPVLILTAEWSTRRTSAILAYAWARALLHRFESEYLAPTLYRRERILAQVEKAQKNLQQAHTDLERHESVSEVEIRNRKLNALLEIFNRGFGVEETPLSLLEEDLRGELESGFRSLLNQISSLLSSSQAGGATVEARIGARVEELRSLLDHQQKNRNLLSVVSSKNKELTRQIDSLSEEVLAAQEKSESLEERLEILEEAYDYVLNEGGGVEALSEDYRETLRVSLLDTPTAPKRRIRPQRSVIVLATCGVGFLLICLWVLIDDQYRRFKSLGTVA